MIRLTDSYRDFEPVAEEWLDMVDAFLDKGDRILRMINNVINYKFSIKESRSEGLDEEDKKLGVFLLIFYKANLRYFVLANNEELLTISKFYEKWMAAGSRKLHKCLQDIFEKAYNDFRKTNPKSLVRESEGNKFKESKVAYHFFKRLNVRTCPYCNRQYTFTISSKTANTSPEYDHFYDKAEFPILALSFYNLVPSCHTCNHIKGKKRLSVNPYFEEIKGEFVIINSKNQEEITDPLLLRENEWKLTWKSDTKYIHDNIQNLGLDLLYAEHTDYIDEIAGKVQAYNSCAKESLVSSFQGAGKSAQDVENFVWGPYIDRAKFNERPLSKLTHDILKEFKVIPK